MPSIATRIESAGINRRSLCPHWLGAEAVWGTGSAESGKPTASVRVHCIQPFTTYSICDQGLPASGLKGKNIRN